MNHTGVSEWLHLNASRTWMHRVDWVMSLAAASARCPSTAGNRRSGLLRCCLCPSAPLCSTADPGLQECPDSSVLSVPAQEVGPSRKSDAHIRLAGSKAAPLQQSQPVSTRDASA